MEIDTNTTSAASIRSPLQAISNRKDSPQKHKKKRKRKRSPKADTKEPPHKKQKTLRTAEHLQHHTTQVLELTRLYDPARFSTDEADEQWTDDPTRKLRLTILKPPSSSSPSSASIWLRFSDLLSQGFKFSASTKPTASATKKHLLHDLDVYLRRRCVTQPLSAFVAKFNGRDFISEPALCILIDVLKEHDAAENVHVAHWVAFRFAYRARLFGRTFTSLTLSKPQDAADTQICTLCCLEDVASNFMSDNACDCQCDLHRGCSAMPGGAIPSEYEFCPLCVPMMPLKELRARRELTKDGDFEVETVVDYDSEDELYTVKWRGYPDQAACQTQLAGSFVEAVETFWATGEHGDTPKKAKLAIAELKADIDEDIDVEEEQTAEIREDVDEGQEDIDAEGELEEAKAEEAKAATPKPKRKKAATPKPKLYIPERLDEVMCAEDIVRGQRFTKATYERFKATKNKYRKWLQREVAKQSLVGRDVARFMRERGLEKLPKFHLRGVNDDWDCDLPRIRDIILDFLQRDWSAWTHDVSHPNVIIADIIDPENPARKYGADQGVHDSKAYGLFATARIAKDTLLFEYAGCVRPIGEASRKLDHLETELDQTTLFDLIGHLDADRAKLFWGKRPNDQLVIDPSRWHNEGVYMNDYRDSVLDDPDDDEIGCDGDKEAAPVSASQSRRKQNVKFFEVLVNNWPRVFAVALCDIEAGHELLGDYGNDFWSNFRLMMRRQRQLKDIKRKINDEWQMKYDALELKVEKLEKENEELRANTK